MEKSYSLQNPSLIASIIMGHFPKTLVFNRCMLLYICLLLDTWSFIINDLRFAI